MVHHTSSRRGISNQMLAGIALILCTVVLFKMKRERYAWVTALAAVWLLLCTLTAGLQKVLHPARAIGFVSHAWQFSTAGKILAPPRRSTKCTGSSSMTTWMP